MRKNEIKEIEMNTLALTPEMQATMLEAGFSASEVAEMHMCECGSPDEVALYKPSRHPVKVCGSCWEDGHWM